MSSQSTNSQKSTSPKNDQSKSKENESKQRVVEHPVKLVFDEIPTVRLGGPVESSRWTTNLAHNLFREMKPPKIENLSVLENEFNEMLEEIEQEKEKKNQVIT